MDCRRAARVPERERTLCSLTAERQMNGDCVCVCMCRAARCEWRLGNTTFVWLRPTRGAARRELAAALTSSSLPFPPPRCRSRLSFAFPPSVGVTDEDLSLVRSPARIAHALAHYYSNTRVCTRRFTCRFGCRSPQRKPPSTQCRHIILSSLSLSTACTRQFEHG
jgi:hypothetical protein